MKTITKIRAHSHVRKLWTITAIIIIASNSLRMVYAQEPLRQAEESVFSQEKVQYIIPGKTTKEEVRGLLGEPDFSERKGLESHWTYYSNQKYGQLAKTVFIDYAKDTVSKIKTQKDGIKERTGFVLGIGLGPGAAKGVGNEKYNDSETGITFELGYAPTERLAVIYSFDYIMSEGKQILNNVQYSYYHEPYISGISLRFFPLALWYLQAGYGFYSGETAFSNGRTYETEGRGYSIHTGYEFARGRNWVLAPDFFYGKLHATRFSSETGPFSVDQKTTIKGMMLKFVLYP